MFLEPCDPLLPLFELVRQFLDLPLGDGLSDSDSDSEVHIEISEGQLVEM